MKALALLALSFTLEAGFLYSLASPPAGARAPAAAPRAELARQAPAEAPAAAPARS